MKCRQILMLLFLSDKFFFVKDRTKKHKTTVLDTGAGIDRSYFHQI